ncbi:DUF6297 family protein [Cellulomonas chengniuliangii]|uniref:DUF6297 family protein n=1 Tax=Cellulomonas chengniuliangii TaxID=2968084 RepID=A0ABY5L0P8_9CELL|nr:DUF6297 family protein [Cellulomonas chengniuliangii]MCC2309913.1 DUF6297 family protein [Cellulomonas chengniuliangii]MCC2318172.1 DUF6297 family protein [Cellulomonas chengniuliangii]UUI76355.1 DUF6297 family protein [Cellulomonas chengniuliangii]
MSAHVEPGGLDPAHGLEPVLVGPSDRGPAPSGRSIRRYTAAAANQRGGASLGQLLNDVYYAVISLAISIGMALGITGSLREALPEPPTGGVDAGISLPALVAVVVVALTGVLLSLAGRLGPVGAGGAEAAWWLSLPVDRRGLLRPASRRLPLLGAAAGAVIVALLDAGLLGGEDMAQVLRAGLGAALGAAVVVLAAGIGQTLQVSRRTTALVGDLVLAAAPVLALVGAVAGWSLDALPTAPAWLLALLAVAAGLLAWLLDRRLDRIPSRSLRESGSVASQAVGAMVSLDSRELGRALTDGAARTRRRGSRRFRGVSGAPAALLTADVTVLLRSTRHVVQIVVAALVPALVAFVPQLAGPVGFLLAILVGGYAAMTATGEGARRAEMAPVLDRLLPLPAGQVRRWRMIVPGVVMLLWSVAAFGSIGAWAGDVASWLALGIASAPVWAGAAIRSAYRPAPNWAGPLVSTPMGALPSGVTSVLARGPDVVILGMIPVAIAILLGSVLPILLGVQMVLSVIVVAVSGGTRTLMERMQDTLGQDPAQPGGAVRR